MTLEIMKYRTAAETFIEQAFVELDAGDLRQASEKGWGAAAQIVKAVAEQRGWDHRRHEDLYTAASLIATEIRDNSILPRFNNAGQLYMNFYEGWMSEPNINAGLLEVQGFVRRLQLLLDDYESIL